jgi:hypothetical protein
MAEKPDGNASSINTTRSNIKSASASAVDPGSGDGPPAGMAGDPIPDIPGTGGSAMKPPASDPATAWDGADPSTGWTGPDSERPAGMAGDPIPGVPGTGGSAMEADPIPGPDDKFREEKPGPAGME